MNRSRYDDSPLLKAAGLRQPLAPLLRSPSRGAAASWAAIGERLERGEGRCPRPRAVSSARLALALLVLVSVVALGFGLDLPIPGAGEERQGARRHGERSSPGAPLSPAAAAPSSALAPAAPLLLADGRMFTGLDVPQEAGSAASGSAPSQRRVQFIDGSSLLGQAGTRVEALAMTERDVVLRLAVGAIDVAVVPGGPRRWIVEAGTLSVEVVGTRFSVVRSSEQADVRVSEGAVLVRSAQLEDGVRRLLAGQELSVPTHADESSPNSAARAAASATAAPGTARRAQVTALLQRADAARVRGDLSRAAVILKQVVQEHPNDPRAGLAAYQAAVVSEQLRSPPAQVVVAFEDALRRAAGASLRQDCYFRLMQAQTRAGQLQASRTTARRALDEYPRGRYAERLNSHLASTESNQ